MRKCFYLIVSLTLLTSAAQHASAEKRCLTDCIKVCNHNRPDLSDTQCHIRFCTKFDAGCLCDGVPCGKAKK